MDTKKTILIGLIILCILIIISGIVLLIKHFFLGGTFLILLASIVLGFCAKEYILTDMDNMLS